MPVTFKFIEDNRNDNSKQEDIIRVLQDKGYDTIVMDAIKNYQIYDSSIKELYSELYRIGIIPPQKIPLKKKQAEEQKTHMDILDVDRNNMYDVFEKISKATNQILLMSSMNKNNINEVND